jgi:hypothetical protein
MMKLSPSTLLTATIINPLESYRIASINLLRDSLELLGPSGLVATDRFGAATGWVLTGIMLLWLLVPLALAYVSMAREERR